MGSTVGICFRLLISLGSKLIITIISRRRRKKHFHSIFCILTSTLKKKETSPSCEELSFQFRHFNEKNKIDRQLTGRKILSTNNSGRKVFKVGTVTGLRHHFGGSFHLASKSWSRVQTSAAVSPLLLALST